MLLLLHLLLEIVLINVAELRLLLLLTVWRPTSLYRLKSLLQLLLLGIASLLQLSVHFCASFELLCELFLLKLLALLLLNTLPSLLHLLFSHPIRLFNLGFLFASLIQFTLVNL